LPRLPNNGRMEVFNRSKDLSCLWVQVSLPLTVQTVKALQPDVSSEVHKDGVERDVTIDIAPGFKWGQARSGRVPFM